MQDAWGLLQEMWDLRAQCGWGGHDRGPMRTELANVGGPTRLAKFVAVSLVQGVEQVCAGGRGC
jgi:hypothetical protein